MKTIISTTCGGLLIGLGLTYLGSFGFFDGSEIFSIIHSPAWLFYEVWKSLGLPPHGCSGFAMIFVSIVIQWVLIGFSIGLISYAWSNKLKKKAQPKNSRDAVPSPQI